MPLPSGYIALQIATNAIEVERISSLVSKPPNIKFHLVENHPCLGLFYYYSPSAGVLRFPSDIFFSSTIQ
jgi:hypothetical protein